MRVQSPDFAELEAFAVELAGVAGAVTVPLFRTDCGHENKLADGYDPVTEADQAAERAIRAAIAARFPDHGVIGEEYGEDRPDAEFVWVLDPVDGTRAFVAGLPLWTTLIALRWQGRPVVGVIAQPVLGEVFLGGPSGARLIDGRGGCAIGVRACPDLGQAVIATTDPHLFGPEDRPGWDAVRAASRLTRLGCDAYAYAMLALGRIDLVIESGLKPWDYEPLMPVVTAAGGAVTAWDGGPVDGSGRIVAAGDPGLLEAVVGRLRPSST